MTSIDRTTIVNVLCNGSKTCKQEVDGAPEVWRTLLAVYLGAILLLSVGFNSTICLVFYKKSHLLSISNCFVLNLACCQLCLSLLVLPFSLVAVVSHKLTYSGPWCQLQGFLSTVVIVTLQLTLLTISLDRNYAIMNSLRYNSIFTQRLCTILTSGSWLTGVIMAVPPLLKVGLSEFTFQPNQFICTLNWNSSSGFLLAFGLVVFGIPILIESGCYIRIFLAAIGHTKRNTRVYPSISVTRSSKFMGDEHGDSPETSDGTTSDIKNHAAGCKAVRTIFLIALSYSICWVPHFLNSSLKSIYNHTNPHLSAASICLIYSSGILNPIIYVYLNRVIRREIGRFICGSESQTDADDFVSTSMSTFSSARQTAMSISSQRIRTRSTGGQANEMGTIVEESEDTCVFETMSVSKLRTGAVPKHSRDVGKIKQTTPCAMECTSKSPGYVNDDNLKHSESSGTNHLREKHDRKRDLDFAQTEIDIRGENVRSSNLKKHTENNSKTILKLNEHNDTKTKSMSKEPAHQARSNKRLARSNSFTYFSKTERRKKRDCGSFLYFEREEPLLNARDLPGQNKEDRKRRKNKVQLDHRISMSAIPRIFNFRLSMTDIHDSTDRVTIRSNVTFNEHQQSKRRENRPPVSSESESLGVIDGETMSTKSAPVVLKTK